MVTKEFSILIYVIFCAFTGDSISEEHYHKIVEIMRYMNRNGYYSSLNNEHMKFMKETYNFPMSYNPFDFMENLRFGFSFGKSSNRISEDVQELFQSAMNVDT